MSERWELSESLKPVTFSWPEQMLCGLTGVVRRVLSREKGYNDKFEGELTFDPDIFGVMGEAAVAKHLNIYFNYSINNFDQPDVGRFQVRTALGHYKNLLIQKKDNGDEPFILVTTENGREYFIRGWQWAREAQKEEYLKEMRGNEFYLFPREELRPMSELIKWSEEEDRRSSQQQGTSP